MKIFSRISFVVFLSLEVLLVFQQLENTDAERDIYDELLTQAEIQGNIYTVNGKPPQDVSSCAAVCGALQESWPVSHSEQRPERSRAGSGGWRRGEAVLGPEGRRRSEPAASKQRLVPQTAAGRAGEQGAGSARPTVDH